MCICIMSLKIHQVGSIISLIFSLVSPPLRANRVLLFTGPEIWGAGTAPGDPGVEENVL